jgi:hypothetical protein
VSRIPDSSLSYIQLSFNGPLGFLAEILLPVLFMVLLIMIKSLTSVYDSPNVAYYCGNTYPWFCSNSSDVNQIGVGTSPLECLKQPESCDARNYYKDSETFTYSDKAVTLASQYGYIMSGASSGQSDNPFYAYTIADNSAFYYVQTMETQLDNPSLPMCGVLDRLASARVPSILVVAPQVTDDADLTSRSKELWQFLLDYCQAEMGVDYSSTVRLFESQSAMENYCTDKHYDDEGYKYGKVAFGLILNSADTAAGQWDYSIRANYTSFFDQDDHTVACLYGGHKSCDFTYTVPSTKFYTQDLFKPQSAEFLYGYTYSGFSTLQQTVDQFIFTFYSATGRQLGAASQRLSPSAPAHSSEEAPAESLRAAYPGLVRVMASVGLMPTASYKTDDFQYIISSTLGIFYMLSFLYPVSRMIRALVLEKETRIKEGKHVR